MKSMMSHWEINDVTSGNWWCHIGKSMMSHWKFNDVTLGNWWHYLVSNDRTSCLEQFGGTPRSQHCTKACKWWFCRQVSGWTRANSCNPGRVFCLPSSAIVIRFEMRILSSTYVREAQKKKGSTKKGKQQFLHHLKRHYRIKKMPHGF